MDVLVLHDMAVDQAASGHMRMESRIQVSPWLVGVMMDDNGSRNVYEV